MVSKHNQQAINESDTHLNANFKRELRKCIESYYEALSHEREEINMTENIKAVKPTLAQLMKENGLTDEQLAEKTGVNKYVIRRIQQKRFKRVMVSDVLRLFTFFDVSFDMEKLPNEVNA